MWNRVKSFNSIWFFDATGSIINNVRGQKKPFLYSFVFHDIVNKCIVPIAEFITTAHYETSITKYVTTIKSTMKSNTNTNTNNLPEIIVTDMGWALINSVMNVFNNCNVSSYLYWCYEVVINKKDAFIKLIKTRMYLCSTHFLKNIIKKVKKVYANKIVKRNFIFMFTLIQNSTTVTQIENYLRNIYNIFNNPFFDETVCYSLEVIAEEIKKRKLSSIDPDQTRSFEQSKRDSFFDEFQKESQFYINQDFKNQIKTLSPFKTYFDEKRKNYQISLNSDQNGIKKSLF